MKIYVTLPAAVLRTPAAASLWMVAATWTVLVTVARAAWTTGMVTSAAGPATAGPGFMPSTNAILTSAAAMTVKTASHATGMMTRLNILISAPFGNSPQNLCERCPHSL